MTGQVGGCAVRAAGLPWPGRHYRSAFGISLLVHASFLLVLSGVDGQRTPEAERPRAAPIRVHLLLADPDPDPGATPASRLARPTSVVARAPASTPVAARAFETPAATPVPEAPPTATDPGAIAGPVPTPVVTPPPAAPVAPPSAAAEPTVSLNDGATPVEAPAAAAGSFPVAALDSVPGTGPGATAEPARAAGDGAVADTAVEPSSGIGGDPVPGTAAATPEAAGAAPAGAPAAEGEPSALAYLDLAAVRSRIDSRKVYPPIAIRNGWEGRVLVEMRLEGDGRLLAVRLLQGSGYAVLDEATLVAVRLASPFPPVARVVTVPVEYRLIP